MAVRRGRKRERRSAKQDVKEMVIHGSKSASGSGSGNTKAKKRQKTTTSAVDSSDTTAGPLWNADDAARWKAKLAQYESSIKERGGAHKTLRKLDEWYCKVLPNEIAARQPNRMFVPAHAVLLLMFRCLPLCQRTSHTRSLRASARGR